MAAGGIHAGRGCNPQSENGKRAVGDAGLYGGSDESAPVFEGAPMRAVGDAVPYGRIRQGAAENAAQAISAHTADRPVHRLGREVIVCGDPWRQR